MSGWLQGLAGAFDGGAKGVSTLLAVQQQKLQNKAAEEERRANEAYKGKTLELQNRQLASLDKDRAERAQQKDEEAFQRLALNSAGQEVTPEQLTFIEQKAPHLRSLITRKSTDKPGTAFTPDVVEQGPYVFVEQITPQMKTALDQAASRERIATDKLLSIANAKANELAFRREKMQLEKDIAERRLSLTAEQIQQKYAQLDAQIAYWDNQLAVSTANAITNRTAAESRVDDGQDPFSLFLQGTMGKEGTPAPPARPNLFGNLPPIGAPKPITRGGTRQPTASSGTMGLPQMDIAAILKAAAEKKNGGGR